RPARERLLRERRPVGGGRRVEGVDGEPDDDRDHHEERDQAADAGHHRRDQHPLVWVPDPAAREGRYPVRRPALSHRAHVATGGGAIASATTSVSWRRRSAVFVKIVMPTLTIWTIPDATIIAPKIPRAM